MSEIASVSIVIPCYNSSRTIMDTLASLEAQSFPRNLFEIIVVDNGSTDCSPGKIAARFPSVRLVRAMQRGSGYARNVGIWAAKGELILSTDADCVPEENWMEALIQAFRAAPPDTAAVGGVIVPYSEATFVERYKPAWVQQPDIDSPGTKVRYAATPNACFRTDRIRDIGGFDGTLGFDDTDLGIRFAQAGYRVLHTMDAVVRHRNPVTLGELYKHKRKYGEFNFTLARRHPGLFGDPSAPGKESQLLKQTFRRVVGDAIKLPFSVLSRDKNKPAGWPLIDAVIAVGNYQGHSQAARRVLLPGAKATGA